MYMSQTVSLRLTMDVTLSFVGLGDEEIRHMSSNVVLITDSVSSKHLLKSAFLKSVDSLMTAVKSTYTRAFTNALSQFCLLIIEISIKSNFQNI